MMRNYADINSGLRPRHEIPPHITEDIIGDAARRYWISISSMPWADVSFEDRESVIEYMMNEIALHWAMKNAGIG